MYDDKKITMRGYHKLITYRLRDIHLGWQFFHRRNIETVYVIVTEAFATDNDALTSTMFAGNVRVSDEEVEVGHKRAEVGPKKAETDGGETTATMTTAAGIASGEAEGITPGEAAVAEEITRGERR